jgi:GH25 family lysozyme M1 (1,4-beta-N-acetylmuramidase)
MANSAQGRDVSQFQGTVNWSVLKDGLAFAYCKATNGTTIVDPQFTANWKAIKASGLKRGAYHELTADATAAAQAALFIKTVKAGGLDAGDMLVCVASDYSGVTGAEVKAFCDAVAAAAGPRCPVVVYTDLSDLSMLAGCTGYELWIAWPSPTSPASVAPWKTWRFWQWGTENGIDADAYNGTSAELDAWIATYSDKPDPAPKPAPAESWEDKLMASMPEIEKDSTNAAAVKVWQGILVGRGYDLGDTGPRKDGVDGVFGDTTDEITRQFQVARNVPDGPDGVVGQYTWTAGLTF